MNFEDCFLGVLGVVGECFFGRVLFLFLRCCSGTLCQYGNCGWNYRIVDALAVSNR